MIVCVCKNISDHAIRRASQAGHDSFEDIQIELGAATCCGKCEHAVRDALCGTAAAPVLMQRIHLYPSAHASTPSSSPFARALRAHTFAGIPAAI